MSLQSVGSYNIKISEYTLLGIRMKTRLRQIQGICPPGRGPQRAGPPGQKPGARPARRAQNLKARSPARRAKF